MRKVDQNEFCSTCQEHGLCGIILPILGKNVDGQLIAVSMSGKGTIPRVKKQGNKTMKKLMIAAVAGLSAAVTFGIESSNIVG